MLNSRTRLALGVFDECIRVLCTVENFISKAGVTGLGFLLG